MKLLVLGAALTTAAALLLSPYSMVGSRLAELNRSNDKEIINARFEQIIEVIENRDEDAFKEMFSEEALEEAEELDEAIEYLFESFPNGIDSWEGGSSGSSDNRNHGKRSHSIYGYYDVYAGDEQYSFSILECSIDTENPEKVGLFSLIAVDDRDRSPRIYRAGIFVAIGDRIVPQPPEKEDPYANEETFELYDLIVTVPAGIERSTLAGAERSVYVNFERDDSGSEVSWIQVSPTRSSWKGGDGSETLEINSDGAPILTPQYVTSTYAREPEVASDLGTGTLTVGGMPAAYIEVKLIDETDPDILWKVRLTCVIYNGITYDFLYASIPEHYDEHLEAAQEIIDSAKFKADNPVKEITFWDIAMDYAENYVEATVSDEQVYLYYRRYNDNVPRFYAKHDDSVLYTDELLDDPVQLENLIQIWSYDVVDQRFKESMRLQEILREYIDINGKRAIHAVFLNQWNTTNDSIEIFLFVHNYDLYILQGKVEHGYEDALTSFTKPIIDSIRFDKTTTVPPKNRPMPHFDE